MAKGSHFRFNNNIKHKYSVDLPWVKCGPIELDIDFRYVLRQKG